MSRTRKVSRGGVVLITVAMLVASIWCTAHANDVADVEHGIRALDPGDQFWHTMGSGVNGNPVSGVMALAIYNGEVIAGGDFETADGNTVNRITRWNGSSWQALGSGIGDDPTLSWVFALTVFDSELIAGGLFTTAGGTSANYITRWNGASWQPVGSGTNASIGALAVYGGELIAAGGFTTAGGTAANYIARWNGSNWQPIGSGMDGGVGALTVYNGDLIAGGDFTTAGGVSASNIARWDGANWYPLGSGTNHDVMALSVYDGELIAGGRFTDAGGTAVRRIASWDGANWHAVGMGTDDEVRSLFAHDGDLYAGGAFHEAGGVSASTVARWDGSDWYPLGSGTNGLVEDFTTYNNSLIVGGTFVTAGGKVVYRVAEWSGPMPDPCIVVDPLALEFCLPPGGTLDTLITIGNDCTFDLNYTVSVTSDDGGQSHILLNGSNSVSGTVLAGNSPDWISVQLDAAGLPDPSTHNWRLEVTSNDPANDPGQGGTPIDINLNVIVSSAHCHCWPFSPLAAVFPPNGAADVDPDVDLIWRGSAMKTVLAADFDDKTLDAPIGTGGAIVGEPFYVSPAVRATVRGTPFATPSLELQDNDDYSGGSARFEFLDGIEIDHGVLIITTDLWFDEFNQYSMILREHGSAVYHFSDLYFGMDGRISLYDEEGPVGIVGSYHVGRPLHVAIVHDLDQGTYQVLLDGVEVAAKSHGVSARGIGWLAFGTLNDADLEGRFNVDNIHVTWSQDCGSNYRVYFGTSSPPTSVACEELADFVPVPSCNPGQLTAGQTYYWYVNEWNAGPDVMTSPVWSFTTAVPTQDTDGDGLLDDWEINGYDANGDDVIDVDLPAMGADYRHRDLFVEVDWMDAGPGESETHAFKEEAIALVVAMFDQAPVSNPDGTDGIRLHIDRGQGGAFTGGNVFPHVEDLNPLWSEFDLIKTANFDPNRADIFRYCVFGHKKNGGSSSGHARGLPGADFVVTLGGWLSNPGTVYQQAGTFAHELGHCLGLGHGGGDHDNRKPNYLSIMSYSFQVSGLIIDSWDGYFDYSRWDLPDLNEDMGLLEAAGLGGPSQIDDYCTYYHCIPGTACELRLPCEVNGPIDWDCDGTISPGAIAADIGGSRYNCFGGLTVLAGHDDWAHLVYSPQASASRIQPDTSTEELTWEEYISVHAPKGDVTGDRSHTAADIISLVNYVFKGGTPPDPTFVGDTNCDRAVTAADIILLVNYVFKGGAYPCS